MTFNSSFPFFEFIAGWTTFISAATFFFCLSTLRSHVDESQVRKEKNISSLFKEPIPPERILTATGKRRVKTAKIAITICMLTIAIIVTRNLLRAP